MRTSSAHFPRAIGTAVLAIGSAASLASPASALSAATSDPGSERTYGAFARAGTKEAEDNTMAPRFRAPYPCGESWTASTRAGHGGNGNAVDFNLWPQSQERGKAVRAAAGGIARYQWGPEGGHMVFVDHGGGWITGYGHLDSAEFTNPIEPGEQIGTVGSSGPTNGIPTLHYAARLNYVSQPVAFDRTEIPVAWFYSPKAPATKSTNCGVPADEPVAVARPSYSDPCGAGNDRYIIPQSTGIQYTVNGQVKPARSYFAKGEVIVVANALPGFAPRGTTAWRYDFSAEKC